MTLDLESATSSEDLVKSSSAASVDAEYISRGEKFAFSTKEGGEVYGVWYGPTNKRSVGEEGEKPPVVFSCHGTPCPFRST